MTALRPIDRLRGSKPPLRAPGSTSLGLRLVATAPPLIVGCSLPISVQSSTDGMRVLARAADAPPRLTEWPLAAAGTVESSRR